MTEKRLVFPDWDEEYSDADSVESGIRLRLFQNARDDFPQFVQTIRTSHSCEVEALQKKLNDLRKTSRFDADKILVMNLDKFVVGLGFQMKDKEIVDRLLCDEDMTPPDTELYFKVRPISQSFKLTSPVNYLQHMNGVYFNPEVSSIVPMTVKDEAVVLNGEAIAYMTPMLDYCYMPLENMTHRQTKAYVNGHETMHAIDDEFAIQTKRVLDGTWSCNMLYFPEAKDIVENEEYRQIAVKSVQTEGFADVGSSGEMIRQGETLNIIDKICDARKEGEFGHATDFMLQGFKNDIMAMGEDVFRSMEEKDVLDFYRETVRKHSVTSEQLLLAAKIGWVEADRAQVPDDIVREVESLDTAHPDVQKAYRYVRHFNKSQDKSLQAIKSADWPFPPMCDQAAYDDNVKTLRNMNVNDLLCTRAFELGGKITPQTVAQAFLSCLEEMRSARDNGSDAEMLNAKMIKLQSKFVYDPIRYVEENQKRGVDILREDTLGLSEEDIAKGHRLMAKRKLNPWA